ncbi:MAG: molecular chaperone TorD family protein [Dehalococcoidia bacterium]|nr:molecular chaperone TorD family protein [Dehalococcoidia bacterium]
MFVYSLAGLKIDGEALPEQELPDNETTARTGVYQLLARLVSVPDADIHSRAVAGEWGHELAEAGKLLASPFEFGNAALEDGATREEMEAEYLRLFEVGDEAGPPAPLFGGVYGGGDRMNRMEEVVRFYEYFGLSTTAEDPRPADHLATEIEFMKYLTFKEAVSSSPRLQTSFRRAQLDFLDRQLTPWLPELNARVEKAGGWPFYRWVTATLSAFAVADQAYVKAQLG